MINLNNQITNTPVVKIKPNSYQLRRIFTRKSPMLNLLENLKREDLNFIEESEHYYNLIKDHDFTQQQLAEKLGKSQSTIANKLRILKLSSEIKDELINSSLTERHARALLRLPNPELQNVVLEKIIKNELTVKNTDDLIDDIIKDITEQEEKKHKSRQIIKNSMSFKIYVNTIKNAYTAIKENGVDTIYEEKDLGDCIEVTVKIPKN